MRRGKKKTDNRVNDYIEMRFKVGGTYPSIYEELVTMGYPEEDAVKMLKYQKGGEIKTKPSVGRQEQYERYNTPNMGSPFDIYKENKDQWNQEIRDMESKRLEDLKNKSKSQAQKTVSEIWTETTGLKWEEAKKRGLTDGTKKGNLALIDRLRREGQHVLNPGVYQMGGEAMDPEVQAQNQPQAGNPDQEQMIQQIFEFIIQSLQEGKDPSEVMGELVSQGLSEQQAEQMIQQAIQAIQGQQGQGPEQMMQEGGESDPQAVIQEIVGGIQEALADNQSEEDIANYIIQEYGVPEDQAIAIIEKVKMG